MILGSALGVHVRLRGGGLGGGRGLLHLLLVLQGQLGLVDRDLLLALLAQDLELLDGVDQRRKTG